MSPFNFPPDFVNELGVKWWSDKDLTHYAKLKVKKLNLAVYLIEEVSGSRSRVVVESDSIVYASPRLEDVACFIDMCHLKETLK